MRSTVLVVAAVVGGLALAAGARPADAIGPNGITAPIEKFEHLVNASKGKACTCVVPPEVTHRDATVMLGQYREKIALEEGYFTIPTPPCVGATCYLIGFEVADATCDVYVFVPYTANKVLLYTCPNADIP